MKNNTPPSAVAGVEQTSRYQPERYWQRSRYILRAPRLSANERLVLLAISDHLGDKRSAWPSADRLAKMTGLARRTVLRTIKALDDSGRIAVVRSTGRANRYRMDWARINPFHDLRECQSDTRATESPVPQSHQCHSDTPPVTQSHPTRDTESPEADQRNGSEKRIKNNTPQGGTASEDNSQKLVEGSAVDNSVECVEKSTEEAPKADRPKKRTRKKNLTAEEVCALPMPEELASMDGYPEAFAEFVAHRIEIKKPLTARALKIHNNGILKAIAAGCTPADVLFSLEEAILKRWTSAYPKPGRAASQAPSQQPAGSKTGADTSTASAEPWDRLEAALQRFRGKPPHTGSKPWRFSDDKHTERAFMAGLKAAAEQPDHLTAWATLWNTCAASQDVRKWQRVRFLKAYKTAIRTRGAA